MTWHYQMTHRAADGFDVYEVREVYEGLAEDGGPGPAYTEDAIAPMGETREELLEVLDMMRRDCAQLPVLEVE